MRNIEVTDFVAATALSLALVAFIVVLLLSGQVKVLERMHGLLDPVPVHPAQHVEAPR